MDPKEVQQLREHLSIALGDCARLQAELDAWAQKPHANYGQCATCGVYSESAKALHDAQRACGNGR